MSADLRTIRSLRHRTGARRERRCGHVGEGAMEPDADDRDYDG
jgi:hypothetical protein